MVKFCSNCGAQVQAASKFCAGCGHALTPPVPAQQPVQQVQDAPAQQPAQPIQVAPEQQQVPAQQVPTQQFVPPPQPYDVQQPYLQTADNQQSYAPAGTTKKKSKLPLILGIAGGVVAVIVIAVVLIIGGAKAALDKTAKADYYEIGKDEIPSVKLALDEERTVTGVSTSVKNDATIKEITYSVPGTEQNKEMSAYLSYLLEEDGFFMLTDIDFSNTESYGVVGRNSVDKGYEVLLQIDYNKNGYTITLVRQKGGITPNAMPTPESTPEIVAKSVFDLIDSGTFHMDIVFVGGDSDGNEMELFKKGGRSAMVLKGDGMIARRLTMDGKFYDILDEYEMVFIAEIDPAEIPPVEYNSSQLTHVGEGTGDWGGTTLPYSEYKGSRGEQMFYFMDGNVLKGIRSISPTGNTVNCEMRAFDSNVPDDAFEWPENYTVEDGTAEAEPWMGLWRYEDKDGVELIQLGGDGTLMVDSRFNGNRLVMTGNYAISEGSLMFMDLIVNDEPYEDREFAILINGDTMIIDETDTYYRVPEEDVLAVLAGPLAPYVNKNDMR